MVDPEFDAKLNHMLREVGNQDQEENAAKQALGAASLLVLLGKVKFEGLNDREQLVANVFRMTSYMVAGMPLVQRAVSAVHGQAKEQAVAHIVRTMGVLFNVDPEPLIETMLGPAGKRRKHEIC